MPVPDPTLINTPPIPADLRDFAITLTDNARTVLRKRYLRRGEDGQPAETEQGMFWRVAYNIALAEIEHGGTPDSVDQIARRFFHLLTALQFFPNSPTFTGAGTPLGQLAACFTADMRVTTSTGQTRIADLTVGDLVLTHEGRYRPVREVYQREYNDRLLRVKIHNIGTALEVTPEHPILTPRGWVKAGELKVGDQVAVGQLAETVQESYFAMAANGSSNANRYGYMSIADLRQREYIAIDQIASEHFEGLVYNCEVEDDHTYVTEGVVVHNCFVLAIDDDMGRTDTGIFQTLRNAALIQQTGGGNGFAFSRLRPKGAIVRSSNGQATGPVGFLRVYDQAFGEIAQGGCLTPDTLVFTDRGLLRLDEIVTQPRPGWYTHNMTVPTDQGDRQSTQGYNNGVAPVFQVTTEAGIQLTGTANHKIKVMTATGSQWRMIGDLQPGDQVMFKLGQHRGQIQTLRQPERIHANQIMPTFPEVLDADLAFLCGYLIATCDDFSDKGDDRMSVTVSRKHAATFERMPNLIHDLFGANVVLDMQFAANDTVRYIIDDQAVKQFLLSNGLLNQKPTADRAIPRLIRQSPADVASAFLDGLFEASELGGEDKDVLANSKRMTQEMYTLIIGLGFAPLYRQTSESNARKSVATSGKAVRVVGNVDVLEPVVISDGEQDRDRVRVVGNVDVLEPGHPTDDLWFTSIASIEAVGESVTLDLEVEDNHTYLANGMVVHNSRRGANMAVLRVDHPDVRDFINCKTNESNITNFNISVGITDAFMRAVESDGMYDLINPQDGSVWETVRAREIYDLIVKNAHHNGEPGVLFLDAANRQNPVPHLYTLESTNPCVPGETLVATPEGWKRVDSIAEGDEICTVLGTGRVATIEVNEAVPVYKMKLSDGGTIRATAAHQFHTRDSRTKFFNARRLDQLKSGDWVRVYRTAIPDNAVPQGSVELGDREYGFLVGVLVGDGCYTPRNLARNVVRVSSHADEHEWNEILKEALLAVAPAGVTTYDYDNSHALVLDPKPGRAIASWVRSLPLEPALGPEKSLPDAYINSNGAFLAGMIDGLFSTDGSVDLSSNHPIVRFHTSSPRLAEQVRQILLMFGIHGRISKSVRQRHNINGREIRYDRPKYDVLISGQSFGRFYEQIRLSHPEKQHRMEEAALRSNFTGGNWAAQVVSIEPDGIERVYDLYEPKSDTWITNGYVSRGCGEQWLGPFENCCLGSINVATIATDDGKVDWEKFRDLIETSTRFLDDVVTANNYVPAVPQLKEAAHRVRRIGIGIMGLADLMYALGVRYGSEEGQEFAGQLTEFLRYHAMKTSIGLAQERGAFPAITGSIYDPQNMVWQPPKPLFPFTRNYNRPHLDWSEIVSGIKQYGIRNGAQTTVAPTGTIATVSGCEGYGCEPVFALAYIRHVNDQGRDLQLQYTSPLLEKALHNANLSEDQIAAIIAEVNATGTCQDIADIPEHIRHTFVVSSDISGEEHIRMQAAMQAFVDNAISKCVTGDTLVMTANGLTPIAELSEMRLPDQFEPLAIDVHTPAGIERTDAFFYGGMRDTRRVELSYGYRIEGTPNHRIHVLDVDGHVKFGTLEDLRIGDTVVLYAGQNVFGPAEQMLPAFSGRWLTNASPIQFPTRMSVDLAYVLGCITSEGAISKNGIAITNGDRALLEKLGGLFESLFGLHWHITKDNRRDSVYTLQVNSRLLRYWLLEDLNLNAGARNKIIPTCILRASKDEIAAFLRGLFLDAYMTLDGRMFGIGLATLKLLRQLQTLMLNFGVVSRIHRSGEHAWALTVSGTALEKLAAFVSFDESWKTERIAIRNEGRTHRLHSYIELMPRPLTAALRDMRSTSEHSLRSLYGGQTQAYQRARVNLLQDHRMDRETAHQLYNHFKDAANTYAEAFLTDDRPEAVYVEVKALSSGFAEVYDLSVPGSHSFIANGLGNHNTCNFSSSATEADVAAAYMLGWKLGCKGMTVYVTGSRDKVVLETHATAQTKQADAAPNAIEPTIEPTAESVPETITMAAAPAPIPQITEVMPTPASKPVKKSRPHKLIGRTYRVETPLGKTYVTINENGEGLGYPFEIFTHTSKAGSDTAAVSEAIGRLISLMLRLRAPLTSPRDRLKEIAHELDGIGGGRPTGFGAARVRSLPDGIARVLQEYLDETEDNLGAPTELPPKAVTMAAQTTTPSTQATLPAGEAKAAVSTSAKVKSNGDRQARIIGDLCPECGEATLVNEEGCRKCYTCGYSEC